MNFQDKKQILNDVLTVPKATSQFLVEHFYQKPARVNGSS